MTTQKNKTIIPIYVPDLTEFGRDPRSHDFAKWFAKYRGEFIPEGVDVTGKDVIFKLQRDSLLGEDPTDRSFAYADYAGWLVIKDKNLEHFDAGGDTADDNCRRFMALSCFDGCHMPEANFSNVNLDAILDKPFWELIEGETTKLNRTYLTGSDWRGSDMGRTEFSFACLFGADLSTAIVRQYTLLYETILIGAKLPPTISGTGKSWNLHRLYPQSMILTVDSYQATFDFLKREIAKGDDTIQPVNHHTIFKIVDVQRTLYDHGIKILDYYAGLPKDKQIETHPPEEMEKMRQILCRLENDTAFMTKIGREPTLSVPKPQIAPGSTVIALPERLPSQTQDGTPNQR